MCRTVSRRLQTALAAITLVLIGFQTGCRDPQAAPAGAAASTQPSAQAAAAPLAKYKAVGVLVVRAPGEQLDPNAGSTTLTTAQVANLQATHISRLRQPSLLADALADPDTGAILRKTSWFRSFESKADALAAMQQDLGAKFAVIPGPSEGTLQIQMSADVANDAVQIARALGDAYINQQAKAQGGTGSTDLAKVTEHSQRLLRELEAEVEPRIAEMERDLGKDNVDMYSAWNGKRMQLEVLLQEKTRIGRDLISCETQLKKLKETEVEGKAPADVQGSRDALENQKAALQANAAVIETNIKHLGTELGVLNGKMSEYLQLKTKEKTLRDQIASLQSTADRLKNLRIAVPSRQVEWLTPPQAADPTR